MICSQSLVLPSKEPRTDNRNSYYLKNYLDNGVEVVDSFVNEAYFFRNDIVGNASEDMASIIVGMISQSVCY